MLKKNYINIYMEVFLRNKTDNTYHSNNIFCLQRISTCSPSTYSWNFFQMFSRILRHISSEIKFHISVNTSFQAPYILIILK